MKARKQYSVYHYSDRLRFRSMFREWNFCVMSDGRCAIDDRLDEVEEAVGFGLELGKAH